MKKKNKKEINNNEGTDTHAAVKQVMSSKQDLKMNVLRIWIMRDTKTLKKTFAIQDLLFEVTANMYVLACVSLASSLG